VGFYLDGNKLYFRRTQSVSEHAQWSPHPRDTPLLPIARVVVDGVEWAAAEMSSEHGIERTLLHRLTPEAPIHPKPERVKCSLDMVNKVFDEWSHLDPFTNYPPGIDCGWGKMPYRPSTATEASIMFDDGRRP